MICDDIKTGEMRMCKNYSGCFFSCAKKSSKTNSLWGAAATGGTGACLVKGVVDLAGCVVHPVIPFSFGVAIGAVSCIIKSVEVCFIPETMELNGELNSEENKANDAVPYSRRKSI